MSSNDPNHLDPVHLNVLPHSGKVDELKRQAAAPPSSPNKNLADQSVVDRALDPTKTPEQKKIIEKVIEAIRQVYDPEIPVNIYDLGLVYSIDIDAENRVHVTMTLTAPGCPVAGSLPPEVERRIETIGEVKSANVELVWDPPWTKDRMSEAAQLELGFL
ncbi:MAG TPA: SUF system Fe-S cluster assembly protein [Tepidisphaeraceae bacterium]|jgi:FeS assembly SUF system protein|nr:SUF system Fe-S cluster assembly protein [Tepidisphaeraceae bacterium]